MLKVGDRAPVFELAAHGNSSFSLAEAATNAPVLLAFFKSSCPVCQYTFPFLERMAASDRWRIVGISQDNYKTTQQFKTEFGVTFPMYLDEAPLYRVSNAYKITHVPSLFLVEGERITAAVSGFSRRDLEAFGMRFDAAPFKQSEKIPEFRPG